jgi:hypothetical protein
MEHQNIFKSIYISIIILRAEESFSLLLSDSFYIGKKMLAGEEEKTISIGALRRKYLNQMVLMYHSLRYNVLGKKIGAYAEQLTSNQFFITRKKISSKFLHFPSILFELNPFISSSFL